MILGYAETNKGGVRPDSSREVPIVGRGDLPKPVVILTLSESIRNPVFLNTSNDISIIYEPKF